MKSLMVLACLLLSVPVSAQCVMAPPTLSFQTIQGGSVGYPPGTDEQTNVLIKNNDTPNCPMATFDVVAEPYRAEQMAGWTFRVPFPATAIPGQIGTAALHIISPLTAPPGTYTIKVTVTERGGGPPAISYIGSAVIPPGSSCTTSPPLVTITPPMMPIPPNQPLAPGALATFDVGITNRNSLACVMSTFDVTAVTAPVNWPVTLLGGNNTVSVGATGHITMQIQIPPNASGGSVAVTTFARQSDAPLNVSMESAVISVQAMPSLNVSVSGDKVSYKRGTAPRITASVVSLQAGSATPAADAIVAFQVTDPHLNIQTLKSVQTDANGRASVSFTIMKTDARGSYRVTVSAMKPGATAAQGVLVFTAQ